MMKRPANTTIYLLYAAWCWLCLLWLTSCAGRVRERVDRYEIRVSGDGMNVVAVLNAPPERKTK